MTNYFKTCFVAALALGIAAEVGADEKVTYDEHLAPIFRQRCASCHNPTQRIADLDVTNYHSLMEGGASGPVVEGGDADASYLFALVAREAEPFMPPNADKIPDAELDLLRRWIDGGALENAGSKPIKPRARMSLAVEVDPGKRPEVISLPPRMVLEPFHTTEHPPMARSLAASPWAPLIAVAGQRQVLLYHTETLELVGVFAFPEGQPHVVRFSRDGRLLLAGGGRPAASGKVVAWDITTGERVIEVGDELDVVLAADITADYQRVALGGPQRLVRVYSAESGELLYEIAKHTDWITAIEFSPDGVLLATGDRNGGLHLWEAHTGNEYLTLDAHTAAITGLSWRGDSNLLASASEDATVRLWEPENGTQVKNWNAGAAVLALKMARDGRIITSGRDQITRGWDQNGKQLFETSAIGDLAISITFCDETNRAVTASWAGEVQVYDTQAEASAALGNLATNPPPLADRLAAAEQRLQEAAAASAPLIEAVRGSEAELAAVESALAAAQQEAATHKSEFAALKAETDALGQSRAGRNEERTQLARQVEQLQASRPLVAEALRHLTEAIGKQSDDAKLNEVHEQLTVQLASMEKRVAKLQAKLVEIEAAVAADDASLKETNKRLKAARQHSAAAAERVAALQADDEKLAAALAAARQSAEPMESALAAAQREVARWKDEIAFRDQMAALHAELASAHELAAERNAAVEQAAEQLSAAQAAVEAANVKLNEAQRSIRSIEAKVEEARQPK